MPVCIHEFLNVEHFQREQKRTFALYAEKVSNSRVAVGAPRLAVCITHTFINMAGTWRTLAACNLTQICTLGCLRVSVRSAAIRVCMHLSLPCKHSLYQPT